MKITRVRLQSMAVTGLFTVLLCYCEAMTDSPEYLAELQLIGLDEFFAAQMVDLSVKITNRGSLAWPSVSSDLSHPVRISYHWIDARGKVIIYEGRRTELPRDLAMGDSLIIRASVLAPPIPGTYTLVLDLVRENMTWFANRGSPPLKISAVEVQRTEGFTWQRARILCIVAGTSLLLFLMGVGTTRLLAPDFPVVMSPLMGIAAIVTLSYYLSLLGMSMARAMGDPLPSGSGQPSLLGS